MVAAFLILSTAAQPSGWKPIPEGDAARQILDLLRADQPSYSDLPDGSTYNYIWGSNMLAWMSAERSGLMPRSELVGRISGLLNRVEGWETYHGFYFDGYDRQSGKRRSDNIYFQGWWLWALIVAKEGYPELSATCEKILSRLDYRKAQMISPDGSRMAADFNVKTGKTSFYIDPTGDISGELRTPLITYTWLTGDTKPWEVPGVHRTIDVGGEQVIAVWHSFTFDPFFVHSCFPESGLFASNWTKLLKGAEAHRKANGMTFYATRTEPLEAWNENPSEWPNTEHRVAKPWIAWLANPSSPVMQKAWVPKYGVVQRFDNWSFRWGSGETQELLGTPVTSRSSISASLDLEILSSAPATDPAMFTKVVLDAIPDPSSPPDGDLVVTINGVEAGRTKPNGPTEIQVKGIAGKAKNTIVLSTTGRGSWKLRRSGKTFRQVKSIVDGKEQRIDPPVLEVFVEGQRADRENAFAYICRAGGAYDAYPWRILEDKLGAAFGDKLAGWVSRTWPEARQAHWIYTADDRDVEVIYHLSEVERAKKWRVAAKNGRPIQSKSGPGWLRWQQPGRTMVRLQPLL